MDSGSTKVLLSNSHHHHHHHGVGGSVNSSGSVGGGMKRKSTSSSTTTTNNILSNNTTSGNYISSYNGFMSPNSVSGYNSMPISMGITSNSSSMIINSGGGCAKCGGKKRHSKTCIFRRNDDDDAIVPSKDVIQRLDVAALKRYKKHYRLKTKHNSSKAELASIVRSHFDGLPVNEGEIIENFMVKVKKIV